MAVHCSLDLRRLLTLALAVPLVGCSIRQASKGEPFPEGKLITAEHIEKSGATTAWDALKRSGTHLSMRESVRGEPTRLTYRGHSSILLSTAPQLYVDGAPISGFGYLRDIPAKIVESIRVYDGVEGTKYYGTGAGNGVIVVRTKTRLED